MYIYFNILEKNFFDFFYKIFYNNLKKFNESKFFNIKKYYFFYKKIDYKIFFKKFLKKIFIKFLIKFLF
jgi:hypothetical protein